MIVSIIIPVYNEEVTVAALLERVMEVSVEPWEKRVIVIDDGSQDKSSLILEELGLKYGFTLLKNDKNQGKGNAIRHGLKLVSGDAVLIQDADLEYNPEEYPALLRALKSDIGAVFGSRMITGKTQGGYFHYILGAKLLNSFTNLLFHAQLTDIYTCYKLIRTPIMKSLNLEANGFELEAELASKLLKNKVRIVEVPITYKPRSFTQGKKIRGKDAVRGLLTILKYKLFR